MICGIAQVLVFLHGGPGGGGPQLQKIFRSESYQIILFSQKRQVKAHHRVSIKNNSTEHLITDIEKLREHLNINEWIVFGGSWGSTLALVYAIAHPDRVKQLFVVFSWEEKKKTEWLYCKGASELFPEAHEKFLEPLSEEEKKTL